MTSRAFSRRGPKRAHLLTGRGVNGEVTDLRADTQAAFEQIEGESAIDVRFSFDGVALPAAGVHTGQYGFCHTTGVQCAAGVVVYDDGKQLFLVAKMGMLIISRIGVVGAINLTGNSIYMARTGTPPFSWTLVGGGGGGGPPTGDANTLAYFDGTGNLSDSVNLVIGALDPFGRPQIHDKRTNAGRGAIIRMGSWGMDGDPGNIKSEGIVLYGGNSLGNGPDGTQGGMFFATTGSVGVGQIIPTVNGGNMFYAFGFENASPDNPGFGVANQFIINDDTALSVFEVNRLLGTTIIGKAGVANGGLQLGGLDPFGRPMIRDSRTGGAGCVYRQGQWQSDGDPLNIEGDGAVFIGKNTLGNLTAGEGAYARVKKDRFGLYQITPAVPGGYYMFRADGTGLTLRDDTNVLAFEVVRSTGAAWARELHIGSAAGPRVLTGVGTPEGSVVGSPGDLYLNTSGGANTTLYVKESGAATNTGWVGK